MINVKKLPDRVTIRLKSGAEYKDIPATVESHEIIIFDTTIPIDVGDEVTRTTDAGVVERYVVDYPGFSKGNGTSIQPFYAMKVRRLP